MAAVDFEEAKDAGGVLGGLDMNWRRCLGINDVLGRWCWRGVIEEEDSRKRTKS